MISACREKNPLSVDLVALAVNWGGAEVQTVELANALAARGHLVRLVSYGKVDLFADRPIDPRVEKVFRAIDKWSKHVTLTEWWKLIDPGTASLAIVAKGHHATGGLAWDAVVRAKYKKVVTIEHATAEELPPRTTHSYLNGFLRRPGLYRAKVRLQRRLRSFGTQRVIAVSDAVRDRLVESFGYPSDQVVTIHNGVDGHERFVFSGEARSEARRRWDCSDSAFVFGALSRLDANKNHQASISSLGKLREENPDRNLKLVLIGSGDSESEHRAQAVSLGLATHVIFPGPSSTPWREHPGFDAFLMPSLSEGLPLSLVEAMACERVAIAMACAGCTEIITSPKLGFLTPERDETAFANAMRAALHMSPAERAAMGRNAREHALMHFDLHTQLGRIVDEIEKVAGR